MSLINTELSHYRFLVSGMPDSTFTVVSLHGYDTVARPYEFELTLHSDNHDIAIMDIVMCKATIFLNRLGIFYPYSGIITECSYIDTSTDYAAYCIVLRPQLWKMTFSSHCRIFQKKSVPDIIKELCEEAAIGDECEWYIEKDYPVREYVVQYNETNFAFLTRLCEQTGLLYFFREAIVEDELFLETGTETLVFTDQASSFENLPSDPTLLYRPGSALVQAVDDRVREAVSELDFCRKIVPKTVMVKNHNYHTPEIDLSHLIEVPQGDRGLVYEYGGTFENATEAQHSAEILANRLSYAQTFFKGKSDCRGFRAGNIITIDEHPRSDCNVDLFITTVEHTVTASKEDNQRSLNIHYHNNFTAVPAEKAGEFQPDLYGCTGNVPGILSTLIENNDSQYAYLDETGHYKLRLPFDRSDTENCQGSKFIREGQAYSGSEMGIHLPSHGKSEMLIGHILGNPDHPVGVATVPNANTISPVTSKNRQQSIIRTAGNNEIIMDDTADKIKFSMITPYDQSYSAKGDQHVSVGGDRTITVKKDDSGTIETDQKLTVDGDQTVTVDGNHEVTIKGTHDQTVNGDLTRTISGNHTVEVTLAAQETIAGNRTVEIGGDCGLSAKMNTVSVQGNCDLSTDSAAALESKTALLTMQAAGDIVIEAPSVGIDGTATVTIMAGASSLIISPAGIVMTTPSLKIAGTEINLAASTANTLMAGVIKIN